MKHIFLRCRKYKWAEQLYRRLKKSRWAYLLFTKENEQNIRMAGKKEDAYYVQKLQYTVGLWGAGIVVLLMYLAVIVWGQREEITFLERPGAHEEAQTHTIQAGGQGENYVLEVAPIALTWEVADQLFQDASVDLRTSILGNNESPEAITRDLLLAEALEGYPFEIYWYSDREEIIDTTGSVNRERLAEDTVVILTAEFCYADFIWQEQFPVLVLKETLEPEAWHRRALEDYLLSEEEKTKDQAVWTLPKTFNGQDLQYYRIQRDPTILWLAILFIGTGLVLWFGQDIDLRGARNKRREYFRQEYTVLVNSLSLYISAGMTLQRALLCCITDYERRASEEDPVRLVLEELRKELENGYSFQMALERFSERCDEPNYKKLTGILVQGLFNGAKGLSEVLEKEVKQINEEKRRQCKIKGEQISTALIGPMMLQLAIVIALIMLPAFHSMQF